MLQQLIHGLIYDFNDHRNDTTENWFSNITLMDN